MDYENALKNAIDYEAIAKRYRTEDVVILKTNGIYEAEVIGLVGGDPGDRCGGNMSAKHIGNPDAEPWFEVVVRYLNGRELKTATQDGISHCARSSGWHPVRGNPKEGTNIVQEAIERYVGKI